MKKNSAPSEPLGSLPKTSDADVEALRRAREVALSPRQLRLLLESLPAPSREDLAARPILDGEPFTLPARERKERRSTR